MAKRRFRWFSAVEKEQVWSEAARGESLRSIGRRHDRCLAAVRHVVNERRRPTDWERSAWRLSLAEREEISRGLVAGLSVRAIAAQLDRSPSTISREVAGNGGARGYRAFEAERVARRRARRPKPAKLALNARLRADVEAKLELRWSPAQISAWLRRTYPGDREMYVAPETIYQSLFVQGRGALRKELAVCLRTGRAARRPRSRLALDSRGRIPAMISISERPAEVADRAVPGHWEGDLIIGKGQHSAVGTLVERSTRFLMLLRVESRTAETVRAAITRQVLTLPAALRRSLTWDQGKEMAEHARFTIDTGVAVYFCDPHSPWQRGTNENTNGLVRQYLPKGTDLNGYTQDQLDGIADELNGRPRHTLGWLTPSQALAELVATTA